MIQLGTRQTQDRVGKASLTNWSKTKENTRRESPPKPRIISIFTIVFIMGQALYKHFSSALALYEEEVKRRSLGP